MEIARSIELGEYDVSPEVPNETAPTLGEVIPQFIELHAKPNTKDWKRTASVLCKFDCLKDRPLRPMAIERAANSPEWWPNRLK